MDNIYSFALGLLFGALLAPNLAKTLFHTIGRQIYLFERQCKIFYILRKRYKDKDAIDLFYKDKDIIRKIFGI